MTQSLPMVCLCLCLQHELYAQIGVCHTLTDDILRSLDSSKNLLDFSSLVFIALLSIIIITIWIVGSARNMLQRSLVQFDIGKFF